MAAITRFYQAPTVSDILSDELTKLSLEFWGPDASKRAPFDAHVIEKIYTDIDGSLATGDLSRVVLLELSRYLENYLWPNFDASSSSLAHLLSIIVMVNEKRRENVDAWGALRAAVPLLARCHHSRKPPCCSL